MYTKWATLFSFINLQIVYIYIERTHTHAINLCGTKMLLISYNGLSSLTPQFWFYQCYIYRSTFCFNSQVRTPNSCNCKVILQTMWSQASIAVVALYRNVSALDSRGCWDGTDSSSSSNIHDQCWSITDIFEVRGGVWLNNKSPRLHTIASVLIREWRQEN